MKAAYIHIPFCEHICFYCDFNKVFLKGQPVDEYIEALLREMKIQLEITPVKELETIFVGGGTPTVLDENQLDRLCNGIRSILPFQNGEFTFEANPGDLSDEKLSILHEYGVNRLSFGVQSFNNELLKKIGRTHTSDDVFETLNKARNAGFENISIDLMYALPGQTENDFRSTLKTALDLDLPHYSSYSLIVEPKTIFYNLMRKGKLHLPSEDVEARMYDILMTEMEKHGLHQYEISNFAKPGYESKHNLVYWDNEEYFGFGAGAHSYVEQVRKSNFGPVKKYIHHLDKEELPIFEQHKLTKQEMMEEEMFLGLRKNNGVSLSLFKEKYEENVLNVFGDAISEMVERKLLEIVDNRIKLTKEGRFLGNEVFQSFLLL
ncbi:radical SAM family heme chaperone HemW [Heyndrickxia camelliae]|uniref:Heme chaperone HemW n=1 Tax=Heyndrickxia camelliae TaxID=1707093 RepID=A0A2N3LKL0_9BACI|nr:radical SAM family heme chaperone HemW [Heyndrickxia camelliae]PKR85125.1 coproporphyrinogen III oxidase [Heyndrickxia camelliae]